MNKDKIQQAINLLQEALNQTPSATDSGRFTGQPTEFFGRVMPEAQAEIDNWKQSDDEYMAKGAIDVDNNIDYHVFFKTEEQFSSLTPDLQKLMRHNWQKSKVYTSKRCRLWPMVDFNNYPIPGHYFWNLGNYTLFTKEDRADKVDGLMDVKSAIQYWVQSESQKHKPWPPKD